MIAPPIPALSKRFELLGVPISVLNLETAVSAVRFLVDERRRRLQGTYICVRDVNGIVECQRDSALKDIHKRAALVTPDGMPVVWWGRLTGHADVNRVAGSDLMMEICRRSVEFGFRHFFFGGEEGVAEDLARKLGARFPGLSVVGTWTPPFRSLTVEERAQVIEAINRSGADIVWVGLGAPKQERFMADIAPELTGAVLVGVGAAYDFLSGRKPRAPRWLQRSGLEWLFRLATEPRRLWRRYLVNNSVFLWLLARHLMGGSRSVSRPNVT